MTLLTPMTALRTLPEALTAEAPPLKPGERKVLFLYHRIVLVLFSSCLAFSQQSIRKDLIKSVWTLHLTRGNALDQAFRTLVCIKLTWRASSTVDS